MQKKAKKAVSKSMLRRYLAGLLTVITFLTAIPLSNLTIAKAVDEHNYSLTVTINLDGGSSDGIFYKSNVDRNGCGYTKGQWVDKLGIGKTFLDKYGVKHTVEGRNADTPCEGTFTVRADAVGITPYVVVTTPTRSGYTFTGWSTNTGTADYGGNTAFEVGAYAPDNITITATWSRDSYALDTDWDEGINYIYQEGGIEYDGAVGYYTPGSTATTKINMKPGYEFAYYTEDDEYYSNHVWTDADANGTGTWNMFGNRHVTAHTRRIQYGLDVNEYVWNPNTNKYEEHDSNFTYARVGLKVNDNTLFSNATDAWSTVYYGDTYSVSASSNNDKYTIDYISSSSGTVTESQEIKVYVRPKTYTIKYMKDANIIESYTATYGKNSVPTYTGTPTKTGMTFTGWTYRDDGSYAGGGKADDVAAHITGGVTGTVYIDAQFDANDYVITLQQDNATTRGTERVRILVIIYLC